MKKHNLVKVVSITILIAVVLTWILPSCYYQYSLVEGEKLQLGLSEILTYPTLTLGYFGHVFMYVLMVGGLYGVLNKIGAYRNLLDTIVKKFKNKEWIFLTVTVGFLAVVASATGLSYELMVLFPFLISVILLMGYNKLLAATVTVGSVLVGIMGSTYNYVGTEYINNYLSSTVRAETSTKVVILAIGLVILLFNVLKYAKHTKNTVDMVKEDFVPAKTKTKKSFWPLVIIFDLLVLAMILSYFPWSTVLKIDWFTKLTTNILDYEIKGVAIFGKILGEVPAFGLWTVQNLTALVFATTVILAFAYSLKLDDFIEGLLNGFKKAAYPGALMLAAYTVLIISVYNPVTLNFIKELLGLTTGLNVVTMSISAVIGSIFSVETLYVAQNYLGYVTSVITDRTLYPLIAIIFQSMYGFAMLFAPTSIVLLGTLAYLKVPYGQWLKHIWKMLAQLFIVLLIIFTIVIMF